MSKVQEARAAYAEARSEAEAQHASCIAAGIGSDGASAVAHEEAEAALDALIAAARSEGRAEGLEEAARDALELGARIVLKNGGTPRRNSAPDLMITVCNELAVLFRDRASQGSGGKGEP